MWRTVARVSVAELARRRTAMGLLLAIPFVLYATTGSVGFLVLVAGWALATLALFSWVSAARLDRRLAVAGARPTALFVGRGAALGGLGLGVALAGCAALAYAERGGHTHAWAFAVALVAGCVIAVPLGATAAQIVPREMEGALAVMLVMAVQFAVFGTDRGPWTWLLPLDGPAKLVSYGYELPAAPQSAAAAIAQSVVATMAWTAVALGLGHRRLRPVPVRRLVAGTDGGAS